MPVEFASAVRVGADPQLLDEFIVKALGLDPNDPVLFISDESAIADFGDGERVAEILSNIREHFGEVLDDPEQSLIVDVLERIRARK